MARDIKVDGETVSPGAKALHTVQLPVDGTTLEIPIFLINGSGEGPTLVVTGGIHGAEYASIEAALELGRTLDPGPLSGRVIIVPVVSVASFKARSIYVNPLDRKNLNRVFPGRADGTASEQLAYWLVNTVMKLGDYYIDLHGGDLVEALTPFSGYYVTGNTGLDARSAKLAEVFGIRYIIPDQLKGSTLFAAAQLGLPAMLAEAGGMGVWRRDQVEEHTRGLDRVLRHLGMLQGPPLEPLETQVLGQDIWLRSERDGFFYTRRNVGDMVQAGEDLGAVTDTAGQVLQQVLAPMSGVILFQVSSLAMNQGDPLVAVGG